MEKILLILLFFVSLEAAMAQDKIITIKHDTIECRIVSVNAERISYEQKASDKHIVGKSISISEVFQYVRTGKSDSFGDRLYDKKTIRQRPEHRWLFSLQGGLAHSLTDHRDFKNYLTSVGNSTSAVDDFLRKVENGYHLNTSIHYLLTTSFGLGLDYNLFYAASKGSFMFPGYGDLNFPVFYHSEMDERLYIHFAGASVLFQQFPDKKKRIKISETLSPGVVEFRNESRDRGFQAHTGYGYGFGSGPSYYDQVNSVTKSNTFGAKGGLSVEYGLTPQLSAGLAGNFMWAKLQKISTKGSYYDTKDQKLEKSINISHIDYGFTVRYNF